MRSAAEFVRNLKFDDLDQDAIERAKDCLLDFMGAVLGGANTRAAQISLKFADNFGGRGASTVWCTGDKTSAQGATFVHGTVGSALDIDDGHRMAVGHPGGVVIPAAVSVAEENQCSGQALIEAVVCGYEVGIRSGNISISTNAGSGRWGSLGAAAAVAKILGLNPEEIERALAISATFTPVALCVEDLINMGFMPMSKFSSGWGGVVGLCSALLGRDGFTGISSTVDFSKSSLPAFGEFFETKNVYFKPYTCCRWTHPAVEGTLSLLREYGDLNKDTIRGIRIKIFSKGSHLRERRPQTMESAQYSIPFLLGAAIIDGELGPDQVAEGRLSDQEILRIADKVEVVHSQELDPYFPKQLPTEIEIETTSGSCYRTRVTTPKGDPKNPMSDAEFAEKFHRLARMSVDVRTSEALYGKLRALDRLDNVLDLTQVLQEYFRKKN